VLNGEPLERTVLPTELAMRGSTAAPTAVPFTVIGVTRGQASVGA